MKRKEQNLNVEFYINPNFNYNWHKLNILKECLVEWNKVENLKFYPHFGSFKYVEEQIEGMLGQYINVFHCYTTWEWVSKYNLFNEVIHLNEIFEN